MKYSLKSCYCSLFCVYWPFRSKTPSQSEIFFQSYFVACSLCSYVCIGLSRPVHPPKVKYSLKSCYCSLFCIFDLSRPKHPPKVKYFFVIVACSVYWPFIASTPSQSEIFFQSYSLACSLCSYVCIGLSRPVHPPKVKYFSIIVASSVYWPFRSKTPSQSEIFSQCYFFACSLCSYVCIGLSLPVHPPKVKYSLKNCYCSLFCIFCLSDPKHPPKVKYSLKSCYCSLFCIFDLSDPAHPPKVKYLNKLFFCLLYCINMIVSLLWCVVWVEISLPPVNCQNKRKRGNYISLFKWFEHERDINETA